MLQAHDRRNTRFRSENHHSSHQRAALHLVSDRRPLRRELSRRFGCALAGRSPCSQSGERQPLSLYFHIPFCSTICYYCACNKIITKDHGRSAKYLKYLAKEIALQRSFLADDDRDVAQLHWGGGTPTFLRTTRCVS